jgi:hypothetical protein
VPLLQGKFRPRNPQKYQGNPTEIIYRSSWEKMCMNYFDLQESIHSWSSEERSVSYYDPVKRKWRRYFPDFIISYRNRYGQNIVEMIEVKPEKEVKGPPKNPPRRTKSWAYAVNTYCTNQAKWKAAREYCKERGWRFRIITERSLPSL